jgi:2-polyprenyl-3-methyl-5-hydroxy-6-metoxy-1,4-benzoquinol methylase
VREGRTFDFVITNSVLHHVAAGELPEFRAQVERATRGLALMNDIRRSRTAYTLFASIAPLFLRRSFSVRDGLLSVRRSYTQAELAAALGPRWSVTRAGLHRLLASWSP